MITRADYQKAQRVGAELIQKTGIAIHPGEMARIDVADFGLSDLETFGAQILTLVNTDNIAAKLIAMHPFQTMPEHWHPQVGDYMGKEETIRCEWGVLFLYGPGEPSAAPKAVVPEAKLPAFTQWHERLLKPADQVTFPPNTPHWFQAGPEGVVVWSFSTKVIDLQDLFTDPEIRRDTVISED
jgi:D-lyxose ketol-isomerase